jgi:hypothetical protein
MRPATEEGVEALKHKPPPGATPPLEDSQRVRLKELMNFDAQA